MHMYSKVLLGSCTILLRGVYFVMNLNSDTEFFIEGYVPYHKSMKVFSY